MELCIQLAIVMIGDQTFGAFTEYGLPIIQNWWNAKKMKTDQMDKSKTDFDAVDNSPDVESQQPAVNQFINEDHKLLEWDVRGLFDEYLEMGKRLNLQQQKN